MSGRKTGGVYFHNTRNIYEYHPSYVRGRGSQ